MWKIVSVCSIAMTCMLSPGIVCASQDSAAFIESLRDQSDMLRRQATVPEFLQQPAPGKHNDAWIQSLTRKSQQASARSKKTPRALYFLSFSIPEDGLIRMLPEAGRWVSPHWLTDSSTMTSGKQQRPYSVLPGRKIPAVFR